MKQLYALAHLSKQGHHQAVQRLHSQAQKEVVYVRLMEEVRSIHPGMGLRTMYDMVQPDGIGRDAFIALGLREGFRLQAVEKHPRTTRSVKTSRYTNLLDGRRFTAVNQLWSSDITYVYCLGRFYYLVLIMDVYSRRIIGYSVADNMRAENNFTALQMALQLRGIKDYEHSLIHHSDKGSQYASDLYTDTLDGHGISISMCREVYENTHIERVNDTIKNQYLLRMDIGSEQQLQQRVARVIEVYNTQRPHQSLPQKMTPVAYEHSLKNIALPDRIKMQIFTVQKDAQHEDPNQLKLVFS
jgi:transposase InsO family protein